MNYQTFAVRFECKSAKANKDGMSPVCVVVTINKEHSIIQTKQRAKASEFKKLITSRVANPVKNFCDNQRADIQKIYTTLLGIPNLTVTAKLVKECYVNGIDATLHNISQEKNLTLQQLLEEFKKQKTEDNVLPSTWKKYENAWNKFLEQTEHKNTESAHSIKHSDVKLLEARCYNKLKMQETTVKKMEKNIKAVFAFGMAAGYLTTNPFGTMKIGKGDKEKPTEYLTYEEIEKVRAADLRCDRLDKVRDTFLFQCFTGLNISDLTILKPEDIQFNGELYYIKKERYKRGKFGKKYTYTTILFEDAIDIYKVYKGKIPYISTQKYNEYLGEVMMAAGISKHITTKCGRTTFANYLLNRLHLEIPIISKMLGHHSVKQTEEYLTLFDATVFDRLQEKGKETIEEMAEAWENDIEPDYQTQQLYKKLWGE